MSKHKIGTIINFCSNDAAFLAPCIEQAKKFSQEIYLPVCDHFFDGSKENQSLLEKIFQSFPTVHFLYYPFSEKIKKTRWYKKVLSNHFWHSLSRYLGYLHLSSSVDYVLFLDVDEIVDGDRFLSWLDSLEYKRFHAMKLSNYWYFKKLSNQALAYEDSVVFIKKSRLKKKLLLHKDERNILYDGTKGIKKRNILGIDHFPMVHHYSWVRSKNAMLKKVRSWGHCNDQDWQTIIEKNFDKDTDKDFVHGYRYKKVKPFISLDYSFCPIYDFKFKNLSEKFLLRKIFF